MAVVLDTGRIPGRKNGFSRRTLISCAAIFCMSQVLGLICWNLVPHVAALMLNDAGASSMALGWLMGTLPQALNLVLTPVISICSDRTRTRYGRRIPYLLVSAPPVCMALVAMGWLQNNLLMLEMATAFFMVSSLVPSVLLYYLVPDAIEQSCIGRFMAWNGAWCSLVAAAFSYWGLAWSAEHRTVSMSMAAGLYALSAVTLLVVKERAYPTAEQNVSVSRLRRLWAVAAEYCRVCTHRRVFILLFLCMGLNQASMILRTLFGILFATKDLGLSVALYGRICGICALAGAAVAPLVGWWVDRTHPLRVYCAGSCLVMVISLTGYFLVKSELSYAAVALLTTIMYSIQSTAYMPLLVRLFPAEHYGQLSSANTTICSLMVMLGSAAGSWFVERLGTRFMFLWDFVLTSLATLFLILLMLALKRKTERIER